MVSKNEINTRDIVLANPMYPDQEESKVRPLLIISNTIFHQNSGFFVCVGITTEKRTDPYLLLLPRREIEGGELDHDSQIMCKRIVTLNCNTIIRKIAKVTGSFYEDVSKKIKQDVLAI